MVQVLRAIALNKASLQGSWELSSVTEHAVRFLRGHAVQTDAWVILEAGLPCSQKADMTLKLLWNTLKFHQAKYNFYDIILYYNITYNIFIYNCY